MRARDALCRFPSCRRRARACDLDHVVPHPDGPTEPDNLLALCRTHHRAKHLGRFRVRLARDGTAVWTTPTGREVVDPPPSGGQPSCGHDRAAECAEPTPTRRPSDATPTRRPADRLPATRRLATAGGPSGRHHTGPVPTDDPTGDLRVTGRVVVPAAMLGWRFSRSSGPGGQGVNTADSRVELSVRPLDVPGLDDVQRARLAERLAGRLVDGVLTVTASEHRQQLRNREAARARMAGALAEALAPPPRARRATRPSRGSVERRITAKKQRGRLKKERGGWD